ncbi:hypothetical protein EV361DRAFT_329797 [Lentinula raphanica]|nr:hypothetical protein EV361DRAFT_329797 [Lentinula raphanica]
MLHFVLRSFSSRALSILLLVVCLLRVAAMDPSPHWDGTMTLDPSNPPRVDIHLGEHYKQSGEHIVLLHFNPDHGYFPPLRGDVPMNQISWTLLGFVQFPSVGHVIYALEQAKKHADKEYQHFSPSNDMNKWWYPTDMMWILHQHYWIDPSTMNRFEDRLPKSFMARRLIRGTGSKRSTAETISLSLMSGQSLVQSRVTPRTKTTSIAFPQPRKLIYGLVTCSWHLLMNIMYLIRDRCQFPLTELAALISSLVQSRMRSILTKCERISLPIRLPDSMVCTAQTWRSGG